MYEIGSLFVIIIYYSNYLSVIYGWVIFRCWLEIRIKDDKVLIF